MNHYVIGLGNPGSKYEYTRHNVAWLILDELFGDDWNGDSYLNAQVHDDGDAVYIKPQTFMNKSGEVVAVLKKNYDISGEQLIVIYDDVDLPFGTVRIAYDRGDGGHNGIKSITQHFKSKQYIRIRVGIAEKNWLGRTIKPNVLSNFPRGKRNDVSKNITPIVGNIIDSIIRNGYQKAMNTYNAK